MTTTTDTLPHSRTPTSEAAAAKAGKTSKTARAEIYYALLARGSRGAIADEMIAEGRNHGTVTGRLRDLEVMGLAERTSGGERRSRYGHTQCVWRAIPRDDADDALSRVRPRGRSRVEALRDALVSVVVDLRSIEMYAATLPASVVAGKITRSLETIAKALAATR